MNDEWFPAPGVDTIAKAAVWAGRHYGSAPALVEGDRRVSFEQYVASASQVAQSLAAHGVEVGDRVAIWAPNSVEFAVCALGVHVAGAVLVPINTRFRAREAAQVIGDCGAEIIFTVESFLGAPYAQLLRDLHESEPSALEHLPVIVPIDDAAAVERFCEDGVDAGVIAERVEALKPTDIATVLFTSGTTGRPKGAMLSHGSLVRSYWVWSGEIGLRPGDRVLLSNPFFHAFGLMVGLLSTLMYGAVACPLAVFDADEALAMIERERITYFPGPPTVFHELLASPRLGATDLSSLRLSVLGATSIPPTLIDDLFDVLGVKELFIPYGFTEGSGVATITRAGDERRVLKETAGRALPGITLEIWDADGLQVQPGEVGEVVLRGYNVMPGYLDPVSGSLVPQSPNRWLRSGDLGSVDSDGNLTVHGRLKDMIIVGGFNVYPAEVEAILMGHPEIELVSVVGVPDEKFGEVPFAFVVMAAGSTADEDGIRAWCRDHLANFKAPRFYRFVEGLPFNASGKVLKNELRTAATGSAHV